MFGGLVLLLHLFTYLFIGAQHGVYVKSKGGLQVSVLSFLGVDPGDLTRVVGLGSKCFYTLNSFFFFFCWPLVGFVVVCLFETIVATVCRAEKLESHKSGS